MQLPAGASRQAPAWQPSGQYSATPHEQPSSLQLSRWLPLQRCAPGLHTVGRHASHWQPQAQDSASSPDHAPQLSRHSRFPERQLTVACGSATQYSPWQRDSQPLQPPHWQPCTIPHMPGWQNSSQPVQLPVASSQPTAPYGTGKLHSRHRSSS
jgi:hypothetical protein